jgi:hypothetical protein
VLYNSLQTIHINIDDAAAVSSFYGPDTADRGLLAGLLPDERFVRVLYLNVLGRPGAISELDAWAGLILAFNAQQLVANDIEHSPEARGHLVGSWFVNFLGRPASTVEAQAWAGLLLGPSAQTEEQVLSSLLATPEFYEHAQSLITSGTADQGFVGALYGLLLNRTPSSAELAAQVSALAALGRGGAALEILTGPEFRTDLAEAYYNVLLHRPSGGATAAWAATGLDAVTMRVDFESGFEFFFNG